MNVQFVFKVKADPMDADAFTAALERMVGILSKVHPDYASWVMTPNGPKDVWVPLANKEEFTAKVKHENSDGVMIGTITNRPNEEEWYKPGRTTLTYFPKRGDIRLEISKPDIFFGDAFYSTMKAILRAFVMEEWIEWASLDCFDRFPDEKAEPKKGKVPLIERSLSVDYRTFPHREFLGWMGWIQQLPPKKLIQASDVPMAAEVHSLPGRSGTIVVSVGEAFDITNPSHIEKMQRVEVRLVELNLLPVIDPELM